MHMHGKSNTVRLTCCLQLLNETAFLLLLQALYRFGLERTRVHLQEYSRNAEMTTQQPPHPYQPLPAYMIQ